MEEFSNKDFIEFMESFQGKQVMDNNVPHKYYDTLTELSRSDTNKADPLIHHSQEMYGLDWIVKGSKKLHKMPPKTTDALYFREDKNGNLKLHIIEFKFISKKSQKNKLCPTAFPAERMEAANAEGMHDVVPESLDCGHVVLNVPAGGRDYTVSYLTAHDESMTVRSVMRFKSHAAFLL